jgi:hypothetical protein
MSSIQFSQNNGKLQYKTSNIKGRIVNITNEKRAELINRDDVLKKVVYQYENFYICKCPTIMKLTKLEDSNVEALYILYEEKHLIIIGNCEFEWNN